MSPTKEPEPLREPDPNCKHEFFRVNADVARLTPTEHANAPVRDIVLDLQVRCGQCNGVFTFKLPGGVMRGYGTKEMSISMFAEELHIPLLPWKRADFFPS